MTTTEDLAARAISKVENLYNLRDTYEGAVMWLQEENYPAAEAIDAYAETLEIALDNVSGVLNTLIEVCLTVVDFVDSLDDPNASDYFRGGGNLAKELLGVVKANGDAILDS